MREPPLELCTVRAIRPATESCCRRTPVVRAPAFDTATARVWLKFEHRQVTGSFKVRGPAAYRAWGTQPVTWVTASAGNHGLGVAHALRRPGAEPPHVFVPRSSPAGKRQVIRERGATLHVVAAEGYDAAETAARRWAEEHGARFLSPFDDVIIMAGNGGTLALEILEQLPSLDTLVLPVGGGGLASGVGCVVRALRPGARLLGVQSRRTSAMHESLQRGAAVLTARGGPTLAEGLEGGVSPRTFVFVQRWFDAVELVEERAMAVAMLEFASLFGERIEGSAAVGLALARCQPQRLHGDTCIVLTGSNVDAPTWRRAQRLAAGDAPASGAP